MITDIHTHIYDDDSYESYLSKAGKGETRLITIHYWTNDTLPKYSLDQILDFASTKDDLFVIAAINILHPLDKQLNRLEDLLIQNKIVGIKMYPGYQHFYPSDEVVYPVAQLCQKYKKPLVFHSGDVSARGNPEIKYSHPAYIDALAVKYPECPIVIAHFGFPYLLETAMIVHKNKNVYTDISGTIDKPLNKKEGSILVKQYNADLKRCFAYYPDIREKIMFGTDYAGEHTHLNQVRPYIDLVKNLFPKKMQTNVLSDLASKLFFNDEK